MNANLAGDPTVSRGSISAPSAGLSVSLIVFHDAIVAVEFGNGIEEGSTARKAMSCEGDYHSCRAGVVEPSKNMTSQPPIVGPQTWAFWSGESF